jgi:hypothetical protein
LATHTAPLPTQTPVGPLPTGILLTSSFVAGEIHERVPSRLLTTHTPRSPTAMAPAPLPTGIVWRTVCVAGSIRDTV